LKILFVHEVSWRKKVVYEIHDFPELLSLQGHEVSFLEFDEDEGNISSAAIELTKSFFKTTSIMSRGHRGSRVRIITPSRFLPGIFGRILAVVLHPIAIWQEIRTNKPEVVVLYGIPTNGWQTVLICRRYKVPVVLRAIDVSHKLRKTRLSALIRLAENFVYRNVNHISANNSALAQYIEGSSNTKVPIDVILPGVDLQKFRPGNKPNELMNKLQLDYQDKVILFMGTLFRFSGLFELIHALADELRTDRKLKLVIIGDGEDQKRINETVLELSLAENIISVGRIEYDELPNYLLLGDVAVLPFLQMDVTEFAFPGKVLQYLSSGLPTISVHLRGLEGTFPPESGFVFVSTLEEMVEKCITLILDKELRTSLSDIARTRMEEMCNWDTQTAKFLTVIGSVI